MSSGLNIDALSDSQLAEVQLQLLNITETNMEPIKNNGAASTESKTGTNSDTTRAHNVNKSVMYETYVNTNKIDLIEEIKICTPSGAVFSGGCSTNELVQKITVKMKCVTCTLSNGKESKRIRMALFNEFECSTTLEITSESAEAFKNFYEIAYESHHWFANCQEVTLSGNLPAQQLIQFTALVEHVNVFKLVRYNLLEGYDMASLSYFLPMLSKAQNLTIDARPLYGGGFLNDFTASLASFMNIQPNTTLTVLTYGMVAPEIVEQILKANLPSLKHRSTVNIITTSPLYEEILIKLTNMGFRFISNIRNLNFYEDDLSNVLCLSTKHFTINLAFTAPP